MITHLERKFQIDENSIKKRCTQREKQIITKGGSSER